MSDMANLLGYKPSKLAFILHKIPHYERYNEFEIPKKDGGKRKISEPEVRLKLLQRRLSGLLTDCFEELYNGTTFKRSLSHGFRKKHSIFSNARNHKNKRFVFNLDLSDFFPSINFGRVRGFFIKSKDFELDANVATIIAQIACYNNELPQGSPFSPVISNLIGHLLDIRLVKLAKRLKCCYSRYADDITFSTNERDFPESIALPHSGDENSWIVGEKLRSHINDMGFKVNDKKVSMQYSSHRQMATGLVVNKGVNVRRDYYKETRSMCHSLFLTNSFYLKKSTSTKRIELFSADGDAVVSGAIKQLEGRLSYIYDIQKKSYAVRNNHQCDEHKIPFQKIPIAKTYAKFLFYKYFFALNRPLLVCEGKTDPIYIKCALNKLCIDYESLVQANLDTGIEYKVDFFGWSKTAHEVFALPTGTQGMMGIMNIYDDYMKIFQGQSVVNPVILLIDNDSGSKGIFARMGAKEDRTKPFYHFKHNLYVVPTPLGSDGKDTKIEDFFDIEILKTIIDGKKFNPNNNESGTNNTYSKTVFAEKVIKVKQNSINFDHFKPLLDRIVQTINFHHGSPPSIVSKKEGTKELINPKLPATYAISQA